MIDDFAKQDMYRGTRLDDVFKQAGEALAEDTPEGDDMMDALTSVIREAFQSSSPVELDGYYVYKIITSDRAYYPAKGTLRTLPTGWIIFACALAHSEGTPPVYYTLPAAQQQPVYQWLKEEGEVAEAPALIFPAAA